MTVKMHCCRLLIMPVKVRINSADVKYTEKHIESRYSYHTASVRRDGDAFTVSLNPLNSCISAFVHR